MNPRKLRSAFAATELKTSLCAQEQIHIPGAIQPHGALLAVRVGERLITHASANLETILGYPAEAAIGLPLDVLLGEAACVTLLDAWVDRGVAVYRTCSIVGPDECVLLLRAFSSGSHICFDIEPASQGTSADLLIVKLQSIFETFDCASSLKQLCESAVNGLKEITSYDRVMAYRFGADGHGEVIAETREASLDSFLGLRYPASDIPPQARRQYLIQKVGAIVDSSYEPVPILSDDSINSDTPLDLSHSTLRSVSPLHRQYMMNMKTTASLTIGLAHRGDLWGMLVCHHGTPRAVSIELRAAAQTIGRVVSLMIAGLDEAEALSQRTVRRAAMRRLVDRFDSPVPLLDALAAAQTDLLDLVAAQGAIVRISGAVRRFGHAPPLRAAIKALAVLQPASAGTLLAIEDLGVRYPQLSACAKKGSGALLLPLGSDDAILWFRPELVQTVAWGGNPTEHGTSDSNGRPSPRTSFAIWKDSVHGRSTSWTEADISLAQDLKNVMEAAISKRARAENVALQQRYEEDQLVQNARLIAALENMGDGLAMYDATGRLVISNRRFGRMYNLPAELEKPGTVVKDIIAYISDNNVWSSNNAVRKDGMAAWTPPPIDVLSTRNEHLTDGRIICVTRRPMSGGGWVGTHEDITDSYLHQAQISYLAHHDTLTGLANRALFKEHIAKVETSLITVGASFAILLLDVDRFKTINDSLGHFVGDELLKEVAERLKGVLSGSDMLARLGGDEFAIIRIGPHEPSLRAREDAESVAVSIINAFKAPFKIDGHSVIISTSIGIALAPIDGNNADSLLRLADLALYEAKAAGRNCWQFFNSQMTKVAEESQQLEADMREALDHDEFELYYQPFIDVVDGRIRGAEALVRWRHPSRGLLPPADFIPLAESTGLIVPLGEWVIRQACKDAARWPNEVMVAVNLSARQFGDDNLLDTILSAMVGAGLPASRLEVEVTESVLLERNASYLGLLHKLKDMGVSVALDDFGTGYSSLSYLKVFPFDKIKIDRSFIQDLGQREDCVAIVISVITLGRNLNMATTAEGVETDEQFQMIRAAGATMAQGYLFGQPVPNLELNFGKSHLNIVNAA